MILALINNKGGVAKTTTAVNLAAALAALKKRVLLVDLDSQAGASVCLGVRRQDLKPSIADMLLDNQPLEKLIRKSAVENIDVVTASNELAGIDWLLSAEDRELRLQKALEPHRDAYDFIILDCPPSLSLLPMSALRAADYYLVPVTPQVLSIGGMASLVEEVNKLCDRVDGEVAELLGFVLTMVDYRNRSTNDLVSAMRSNWKDLIFKTEVRINVKLAEAPARGLTIFDYAPSSTGAKAYRDLGRELVRKLKALNEPGNEAEEAEGEEETSDAPQGTVLSAEVAPA